ncbi:MAG: hypothetical protein U0168_21845 [Nannocystaceae bacterium]
MQPGDLGCRTTPGNPWCCTPGVDPWCCSDPDGTPAWRPAIPRAASLGHPWCDADDGGAQCCGNPFDPSCCPPTVVPCCKGDDPCCGDPCCGDPCCGDLCWVAIRVASRPDSPCCVDPMLYLAYRSYGPVLSGSDGPVLLQ